MKPAAGFEPVRHHEPDKQRESRDDLEVHQRLHADFADFLQIAHPGDSRHDRREDDRADEHRDELHETIAKRTQRDAPAGTEPSKQNADGNAEEDLEVEIGAEPLHEGWELCASAAMSPDRPEAVWSSLRGCRRRRVAATP